MFSYIRWFSIISFVLVIAAAFFVGREFRAIASQDLRAVVESNNESLAKGFIYGLWKEKEKDQTLSYGEAVVLNHRFRASGLPADQWQKYAGYKEMVPALDAFSKSIFAVFHSFEDLPILGISIYTTDGARLISTDPPVASAPEDKTFQDAFAVALGGNVSSIVLENQYIPSPDPKKEVVKGTVIETLIPVMRDNNFVSVVADYKQAGNGNISCVDAGNSASDPAAQANTDRNCVEGVIEIRYDVTPQWHNLILFQQIGTLGVIIIFVLLISLLLIISSKAEAIIARQHEANLELTAQAASAQAENRDKSQFLANVSHELRTPLNAIIGFSEFIKSERSGPIGNNKYGEYIKDIHSSGVHLLSLINDILDYSKAEADKLELEVSEVDATKSVKNSMRLVSPRAEMANVQLYEEIPREHFIIKNDAKKLKQVMLNLLSNAVKFTPGGGSVTVTMWQNVVDGSLSIEVKDTGIGIAPKDISRAMAPFGQVDNTLSRKYEGTGLGLPLTRKFVEIMGGTFNIQSEEGKGTVITVTLPREVQGKAAPPEAEAS